LSIDDHVVSSHRIGISRHIRYASPNDGQPAVIGGASAVAPLWAGLLALINQSLGTNVGYVNPLLYAGSAEASFRDITSGSNGGYSAAPGWDACTGLGSPNGAALLKAFLQGQASN